MPKGFEDCVKNGGRVRTVSGPDAEHGLSKDQYVKYCYIGDDSFRGEVHTKKKEGKSYMTR